IVAARGLPRVALGFFCIREAEASSMVLSNRDKLKQAFIHGAQLLRRHVAPIYAHAPPIFDKPTKMEDRPEERAVRQLRVVKIGRLTAREKPPKRGQPQQLLAVLQPPEDD